MFLSRFAVKRPITIVMITFAVILLGFVSLAKLPIDLLPNIEFPIIAVSVNYPETGPREMENLITIPLEGAIGTISNVKKVRSISSEGRVVVIAEFKFGTNMDTTSLELREKIELIKGLLPTEASNPMYLKLDPNTLPIIQISVTGASDLYQLQSFSNDVIKSSLERINGVASVSISGGYKKQVEVIANELKLKKYGLSMSTISQIIATNNLSLPGGSVKKGNQDLAIRVEGTFKSIEDIKSLSITLMNGSTIPLSEVADVLLVNDYSGSLNRLNGHRCINISVQKQAGTNTVSVAKEVIAQIKELKESYSQYEIVPIINQAEYIQKSISQLVENSILGSILAALVLLLFFKNIKTTLIITVAIPISIIGTFVLLYFNGITLNLMTLGGLALAIGMLVDNAIVVLENIFRMSEQGEDKKNAAIKGAGEVAMAVTASTLTSVAVFLPIVFIGGITSEIFRELALTVTLSLLASLGISLTLIPMLASKFMKIKQSYKDKTFKAKPLNRIYLRVVKGYKKILKLALKYPRRTIVIGVLVFVSCISSLYFVGAEYFPQMDQGNFTINAEFPPGQNITNIENTIVDIEEKVKSLAEVDTTYTSVNRSSAIITVITKKQKAITTSEVADITRNILKDVTDVKINISVASMATKNIMGNPVNIVIKGKELNVLEDISNDIVNIVSKVEGTRMVKSNMQRGIPEVSIIINQKIASKYGLTTAQIGGYVRSLISGSTISRYTDDANEINIIIKGEQKNRNSIKKLGEIMIPTPVGIVIQLSHIANITEVPGPESIIRENQARVAEVSSQIYKRDLNSVTNAIKAELDKYSLPSGYSYEFGGEFSEMTKSLKDLSRALLLSVVLVYMVLASQFESLLYPFIIMFAVPLSLSGGAFGLFITGKALSVPALIGATILAGVVVNDAIVLVDYINTRRASGENRYNAIINAGSIRLRPILITTLTTVLGLIPLALGIGEGAEALAPMAITVIFGLSLATLLTLVFIPIVYVILDNLR
ncbi:efflux RND transporter permease subunit [Clostridium sp. 'deep sea']|uniref:efflux RND transporter permease subunit n=1 Tax=Clostridium sp. 'deep sea' TaxID=2779445 RepID=UPI0018966086|nr:efflux RND transporter permease subunit [Clostridium sp. 'deep sea']QOR36460.1 efflux RND transporter permease subunit [Clostridium sp. 'deep sea']